MRGLGPRRRKSSETVKEALDKVRSLLAVTSDDELSALNVFVGEFECEIEGWKMRVKELEDKRCE